MANKLHGTQFGSDMRARAHSVCDRNAKCIYEFLFACVRNVRVERLNILNDRVYLWRSWFALLLAMLPPPPPSPPFQSLPMILIFPTFYDFDFYEFMNFILLVSFPYRSTCGERNQSESMAAASSDLMIDSGLSHAAVFTILAIAPLFLSLSPSPIIIIFMTDL